MIIFVKEEAYLGFELGGINMLYIGPLAIQVCLDCGWRRGRLYFDYTDRKRRVHVKKFRWGRAA